MYKFGEHNNQITMSGSDWLIFTYIAYVPSDWLTSIVIHMIIIIATDTFILCNTHCVYIIISIHYFMPCYAIS